MSNLPTTSIVGELSRYFTASMKAELHDLVKREDRLRVSSFPICGLQKAYKKMLNKPVEPSDAGKEFYTSVGTAAHLVFQRWLGQKGRIWGDWKCYNKQCNHIVRFSKKRKCPKCKSEMEYEEFEVKAFRHLSGHIDGVYEDRQGNFWVIDYKTTSIKNIDRHREEGDLFPYAKNKAQIMTYCALIEKKHKIKISGWALLYVARDDPFMCEISVGTVNAKQKRLILKRCELYDEQFEVIQNIQGFDDLRFLIETKPCKSYDFYLEHFKGFTGCPLEAVCFTKQLVPIIKSTYKDFIKIKAV